jgi:uncharacterized protein
LAIAAAVLAGGLTATPIRAEKVPVHGVMKVDDKGGLFSTEGVTKAKDAFDGTEFKSTTHFFVYTVDSIPEGKKAAFDAAKKEADTRGRFFKDWAKDLARSKDRKGDVFVLLYHTDKNYFAAAVSDEQSDVHRHMTDKKLSEINAVFNRALKTLHDGKVAGDPAKKEMDAALMSATELVISDLKDTSAPEAGHKASGGNQVHNERKGSGVGGWICMILCILLGVWLVTALIRAFTGGGGGYGGGGYGGGPGYGGGGGFFTSLLGGMFGAAAGMWMYNNFFGGSSYNDAMAGDSYGNDGTADTGDGNYDGGGEAGDGGGDWGDSGGGDAGGGDWGGGDAGGGGDWGGGGGDFGGGGDW